MQLTSPARSPAPPCDGTALRYSSGLPFPACLRSLFITSLSKPVIYQGKIGYPERYESAQGQEDRKYPFSSPDPANLLDDKQASPHNEKTITEREHFSWAPQFTSRCECH